MKQTFDLVLLLSAMRSAKRSVLLGGADVYYAGKAFLCTAVARWLHADGVRLDTCSGGELAVGLRAGMPPRHMTLHGNNKSDAEIDRAVAAGIGRIVIDSLAEIGRVADAAARHGTRMPVLLRVTVGVEAHTHEYMSTAHEDQKFGLSLQGGAAAEAVRRVLARPELELRGLHAHIGSQIFDTGGFEVATRRLLGLHAEVARQHGIELPEVDLGGGFGIAYTSEHDPLPAKGMAASLAEIVVRECQFLGVAVPRVSVEPGRAIAGPAGFTLYTAGTVKDVELDHGTSRRYVAVDGGMSDNIRTALYDADYSCTVASRASARAAGAGPGGGQALRERRRDREGRVPALGRGGRGSARGAGHRGVLPEHGQPVQPRAAAAGDRGPGRGGEGAAAPRDRGRHPRAGRVLTPAGGPRAARGRGRRRPARGRWGPCPCAPPGPPRRR